MIGAEGEVAVAEAGSSMIVVATRASVVGSEEELRRTGTRSKGTEETLKAFLIGTTTTAATSMGFQDATNSSNSSSTVYHLAPPSPRLHLRLRRLSRLSTRLRTTTINNNLTASLNRRNSRPTNSTATTSNTALHLHHHLRKPRKRRRLTTNNLHLLRLADQYHRVRLSTRPSSRISSNNSNNRAMLLDGRSMRNLLGLRMAGSRCRRAIWRTS